MLYLCLTCLQSGLRVPGAEGPACPCAQGLHKHVLSRCLLNGWIQWIQSGERILSFCVLPPEHTHPWKHFNINSWYDFVLWICLWLKKRRAGKAALNEVLTAFINPATNKWRRIFKILSKSLSWILNVCLKPLEILPLQLGLMHSSENVAQAAYARGKGCPGWRGLSPPARWVWFCYSVFQGLGCPVVHCVVFWWWL